MNEEEKALYNTSWKYNVGGYTSDITTGDAYTKDGDGYDRYIINREIKLMEWEE